MGAEQIMRPGSRLGVYPQRLESAQDSPVSMARDWFSRCAAYLPKRHDSVARVAARVERAAAGIDVLSTEALREQCDAIRYALMRDGLKAPLVLRAFALVREYAWRTLGMRHHDVQLYGAWLIVNGRMAEMATGEGKSFTATLAAATAGLAGIPVHLITTNEYLAERDAQEMRALYEAMGLSVSYVAESMDNPTRRAAYAADIAYCTNKQVAFDYLRDRLVARHQSGKLALQFSRAHQEQQLVLRGLCFAIIDEVDSVLIDEARTPLILSRQHADENLQSVYQQALDLARQMQKATHFTLCNREYRIALTETGCQWLARQTRSLAGIWSGQRHARYLVHQALSAIHLFHQDMHYLVRDGRVEIIDKHTGRTTADRSWQQGLHQMIECKEGCALTAQRETLASISYQRFFRRYLRLGGMSGTLGPVAGELRATYTQPVVPVPLHRPSTRRDLGSTVYRRSQEKWHAVLARIEAIHSSGRPILVGTCSVADSELLSTFLTQRSLSHQVLNARQDSDEANIIARAGLRGQITIATNMAGRGTDIRLGEGVAELGGLHVLSTQCHEEHRVDLQLSGRCARQGDPGSFEAILSLNDALVQDFYAPWVCRWLGDYLGKQRVMTGWRSRLLLRLPQWAVGRRNRAARRQVLQMDEQLGRLLAYSGPQE